MTSTPAYVPELKHILSTDVGQQITKKSGYKGIWITLTLVLFRHLPNLATNTDCETLTMTDTDSATVEGTQACFQV